MYSSKGHTSSCVAASWACWASPAVQDDDDDDDVVVGFGVVDEDDMGDDNDDDDDEEEEEVAWRAVREDSAMENNEAL